MLNYIDPGKDLKTLPDISVNSYEQMNYLRHDPYPYMKFDHLIEEERAAHVKREIVHSLIAFGALGLLIGWVML